jgi:hypothetical protein
MSPTLQEIAAVAGCDYDFINNRIRRGDLTTKLKPVEPPTAREFTRQNALEIAFLSALVDIGYKPLDAKRRTKEWLRLEKDDELHPYWAENRKRGCGEFFSNPELGFVDLSTMLSDGIGGGWGKDEGEHLNATHIAVIHVAEIVRRVDTLFPRGESPTGRGRSAGR